MSFQLRKATRTKAKIRLGLSSISGGGKTFSALLIAYGLCGDWDKIAVVDTENNSADLYAHLGSYNVVPISAPFTPERYIQAIDACHAAGMEVIIVDSITHEWDGSGGILEAADNMPGTSITKWAKLTPRHQVFINAILQSPCHMITTARRKQDYNIIQEGGKTKVEKNGLREITREGFEYELTINLQLDAMHNATASKDRTGLFAGKPEFIPSVETGKMIAEWCETGIDVQAEIRDAITKLGNCETIEELRLFKETLQPFVTDDPEFKAAGNSRYMELKKLLAPSTQKN
ncbi:AAA family ATPase [Deminuibacter soli]|uniref:AAA family ATPase n=1 Tax=Deminuibacter soli TaxID=2291815 RepID=A0A3E1NQ56_9BACT|nr:AAA family ATPase [Deminuibacter soli]RFM30061.1 AAA family ATPase [Deminuibacter soli]